MLAELYGCDAADLLDYDDRRALPPADLQVLEHRPAPAPPPSPLLAPPPSAVEPQGAALVEAAADESAAWAMWAESSNVGDLACEQLLANTRSLARAYLAADPPLRVFAAARGLRDKVFALLEGHQHPRQTRELYVLAGYLCGLLAWISSDLGETYQADTHGRTAWLCAELADHDGLRAWTLSTRRRWLCGTAGCARPSPMPAGEPPAARRALWGCSWPARRPMCGRGLGPRAKHRRR